MLFTDIEGSTWLLQRLGERYDDALEQHHRILRQAIQAFRGNVQGTQGDAFFAVFASAEAAVQACLMAQKALAAQTWPGGLTMWVRMGLHTGRPTLSTTGYLGLDVHRAARIAAAGHGGQVLLSRDTASLVRRNLPQSVSLRDLGSHRLKDLEHPERIYQLVAPGLRTDFAPIKSLDARPNNLPRQLTPLIGREREIQAVSAVLRRGDIRLVTLTGLGGTGKTRLAVQIGAELLDEFSDGVFFVALAGVTNPNLVAPTIAGTLGVHQIGAAPIIEALTRFLRDRQVLLVLDNFEHVVAGAPVVTAVLQACPQVKAMVTSRVVLKLSGEYNFRVPPLELPQTPEWLSPSELAIFESVRLFVNRAQAVKADFTLTSENTPSIAEICLRLEGLPLAIELAASRARVLAPKALLSRLENRLKVLTGGGRDRPERQQTLRSTLAWSHELLKPAERVLFRRLSTFAGGFDLEAAELVANPYGDRNFDVLDDLTSLVDASLVQQVAHAARPDRLVMLETVREYAAEQLQAAQEAAEVRTAHMRYFASAADRIAPLLQTGQAREAMGWFRRELNNLRAARDWATEVSAEEAARLNTVLRSFQRQQAYWSIM
jgi:predicted ATPase/class 3 adenylate cyclase